MMRKIVFFFAFMAIMLPICISAQEIKYTIKGKIGKLSSPAKAYLFVGDGLDSAVLKNGAFNFSGTVNAPSGATLLINKRGTGIYAGQIDPNPYALRFYIEPGIIHITSKDSIDNAKVVGGSLNADYLKIKSRLRSSDSSLKRLSQYILSASRELMDSKEYANYSEQQLYSIGQQQKQVFLQFIKENPNSMMSLLVLKCYGGYDYSMLSNNNLITPPISQLDSILHTLSRNVQQSKLGVDFQSLLARLQKTEIGFMAADFTQPDTSGKSINLGNFKGKYVLIDFWASWCKPCRAENPNVVKAFNQYNSSGFTVLGVSLDSQNGKEAWLKAIYDDELAWTQVSDLKGWKNEAALLYGVTAIPQNFLIDRDGRIVAKNLRGEELENTLKNLIKD